MDNGRTVSPEKKPQGASYTYWVREATAGSAPPVPKKLSPEDALCAQSQPASLGSVWNKAGTWEEKSLNKWASDRIKELLKAVGALEFSGGKAEITKVTKCAFLVTVRNKTRVGYNYELLLKVKGEWLIREDKKIVKGHVDIPEFSFGELDDLQIEVRLSEEKDIEMQEKVQISGDLKQFLQPIREKLQQLKRN